MTDNTQAEALAALIERFRGLHIDHKPDGWPAVRTREITALLDRIAELEAQLEAIGAGGVSALMGAAKAGSEPVAWAIFAEGGNIRLWSKKPLLHPSAQPLYTTPLPQREWQGGNRLRRRRRMGHRCCCAARKAVLRMARGLLRHLAAVAGLGLTSIWSLLNGNPCLSSPLWMERAMGSRTTPIPKESYWHWLRVCGRATLPQAHDWRGAWRDAVDLANSLGFAVCMTLARLVLLLALPVSVPILALVAMKANHRAADARTKARAELIDSLQSLQKKEPQ